MLVLLCSFLGTNVVQAQGDANCGKIKDGFFTYTADGMEMYVYRKGSQQIEWDAEHFIYMEGKLDWDSECSYVFKLTELKMIELYAGYSEDDIQKYEQSMRDIFSNAKFEAVVSNANSKGYTATITILGETEVHELKRISKKKGKKKLKEIVKKKKG